MNIRKEELEFKTKSAIGIGRFLTQKIICPEKMEKLISHEVHGASFDTSK
jgi:hypothetical protein